MIAGEIKLAVILRLLAGASCSGGSNSIFSGCIGELDGWLVKSKCPLMARDSIRNTVINVQAIVD